MPLILSSDAETRTKELVHWDESAGKYTLETRQDCEPIIEANKAEMAEFSSGRDAWGQDFSPRTHVARIPMTIYAKLQREGITRDKAKMAAWLDDPDNAVWRTRPGQIGQRKVIL